MPSSFCLSPFSLDNAVLLIAKYFIIVKRAKKKKSSRHSTDIGFITVTILAKFQVSNLKIPVAHKILEIMVFTTLQPLKCAGTKITLFSNLIPSTIYYYSKEHI